MPLSLPRNAQLWLPALITSRVHQAFRPVRHDGPTDVFFCIADHFEPSHRHDRRQHRTCARRRVGEGYPRLAERFADADGRPPQHTFFFPEEDYRPESPRRARRSLPSRLWQTSKSIFITIKIQPAALGERLGAFHRGPIPSAWAASPRSSTAASAFGFVHGNWALDNARPDGRWCGVNNEITILLDAGCYADFTLPAAPDPSQTRTINSIYYAIDDPARPRSHDYGTAVRVGATAPANGLLIDSRPADVRYAPPDLEHVPGLENGAIDSSDAHLPTLDRFASWVDARSCSRRSSGMDLRQGLYARCRLENNAAVLLGPDNGGVPYGHQPRLQRRPSLSPSLCDRVRDGHAGQSGRSRPHRQLRAN